VLAKRGLLAEWRLTHPPNDKAAPVCQVAIKGTSPTNLGALQTAQKLNEGGCFEITPRSPSLEGLPKMVVPPQYRPTRPRSP